MDSLIRKSQLKVSKTSLDFKRYLIDEIVWEDRLIGITGFRGVGKTILMLQQFKIEHKKSSNALYVTLDDYYFTRNSLLNFAEKFYSIGGRVLYLDEVHRYPNWSLEIKNLYDLYDDLKIVFSSSSALQLHKASGDLSRRAAMYDLHELSFREYLTLAGVSKLPLFTLEDIIDNHVEIASDISQKLPIIQLFKEYLEKGIYPNFKDSKGAYSDRLLSTINTVIEIDLQVFDNINFQTVYKLRMLVAMLSDSVPYKVNISSLSRDIGLSRDVILRLLKAIDRANIINSIALEGSAVGYLTKPDKLYLNNTALLFALNTNKNNFEGTKRETFFVNQMKQSHKVMSSKKADFIIDNKYTFEIGGRSKGFKQIEGLADSYVLSDDLEIGFGNKIPLWLIGMMY